MTDFAISQLLDLGLTASQARTALEASGGRVPEAIEWYLLSNRFVSMHVSSRPQTARFDYS